MWRLLIIKTEDKEKDYDILLDLINFKQWRTIEIINIWGQ